MVAEAGSGGVVKHILLARFNEDVAPERLDQLIRGYAGLVDLVPSMKAFHWKVGRQPVAPKCLLNLFFHVEFTPRRTGHHIRYT
uniref:Stress-response A/B barrel domain-containing protein n=1 Tax=Oryza punctata TaxID=4537 RepID=A0A0E0L5T9_ORYPU